MPDLTSPDTDELRRRIEAATPGPWEWVDDDLVGLHDPDDLTDYPDEDRRESLLHIDRRTIPGLQNPVEGDAAFIAAANPAAITVLLDAYEASVAREAVLRAENERLRVALNAVTLAPNWPPGVSAARAALTEGTDPDAE